MKCIKCGHFLPDDSEFCQYCGNPCEKVVPPKAIPPAQVQETLPTSIIADSMHGSQHEKKQKRSYTVVAVIMAVVILLSASLNVIQYLSYQNLQKDITVLNGTIEEKGKEISELEDQVSECESIIRDQKSQIYTLKTNAGFYDEMVENLKYGNIGFASNNFKSSDSIIVVRKSEKNRKFTLTANWSSGGTVEIDYSSNAAWIDFDKDSWYTSTTMTVHPVKEGATVATFSNSVDSKTFKILIIVTK